jgi:hypothetical protein
MSGTPYDTELLHGVQHTAATTAELAVQLTAASSHVSASLLSLAQKPYDSNVL